MTRSRFVPMLTVVAVAAFGVTAAAQKGAKLPPDIKVTTTIADYGGDVPLRVESDRKGVYVTKVVNKVTQVDSVLASTPNGYDWMLTTYYSSKGQLVDSDRKVFFDLTEQISAGGISTPPLGFSATGEMLPYGQATAHLVVKCATQAGVNMMALPEGATVQCPGSFRFRALDNSWYRLSFQPDNYPTVDRVNVTCNAVDANGCKLWTLTPAGTTLSGTDPNPKNRTTLLNIDSAGTVLAVGGEYLVSFSITLAR